MVYESLKIPFLHYPQPLNTNHKPGELFESETSARITGSKNQTALSLSTKKAFPPKPLSTCSENLKNILKS
jgi:hypothetical protein